MKVKTNKVYLPFMFKLHIIARCLCKCYTKMQVYIWLNSITDLICNTNYSKKCTKNFLTFCQKCDIMINNQYECAFARQQGRRL